MNTNTINNTIGVIFFLLYFYQVIYIIVVLFNREYTVNKTVPMHRFAVLICARNEQSVIGNLIKSIKRQTYPQDMIDIFVMADNCTDDTAAVATKAGALVYQREDKINIGKGYALDKLVKTVIKNYPDRFDAFFVFDADNILSENYIEEMNKTFSEGHDIVTSYRNSTNYDASWVSRGYALWFLRESTFLNKARYITGNGCAVSGTGFMFSERIREENGGWPYYSLTEDVQFTMDMAAKDEKIAYCDKAEFFDEQPVTLKQSVQQRLRWARGFYQAIIINIQGLTKGIIKGNFTCYDILSNLSVPFIASVSGIIVNISYTGYCIVTSGNLLNAVLPVLKSVLMSYVTLLITGLITVSKEWDKIHTDTYHKIKYLFTFPIFMFTYLPVSLAAIIRKPEWTPIVHTGYNQNN